MATNEHGALRAGAQRFFVGRDPELAELGSVLNDALSGRGTLMLLEGEAGIGKTRIVEELAGVAERAGARTVWGRCWEGDGAPAFWPWVQILRALAEQVEIPRQMLAGAAACVAQLVPTMMPESAADTLALEPEHARFRLFDGITLLLTRLARREPLLLVVDDLHWADRSSLLLLQFLAREIRDARILLVATYRRDDAVHAPTLDRLLARLAREGRSLALTGLTSDDVARFVAATLGAEPAPELVAALHERTEGNPFFIGEMLRLLEKDGRLDGGGGAVALRRMMPDNVLHTVRRRLDLLQPTTRRALRSASAIGRTFDARLLLAVERPREHPDHATRAALLDALDAAVAARVLVAPDDGDLYRFSHALIRETLYAELPREERALLHQRVALELETRHASDPAPVLAELAHHFAAGESDPRRAAAYAQRAAQRASDVLAFEEAAQHATRALRVLDDWQASAALGADVAGAEIEALRCAVLLTLATADAQAGETPRARQAYFAAAALARRLGDPTSLARAALGAAGRGDVLTDADPEVERLLEEAIAALSGDDGALLARLLGRLAMAVYFGGDEQRRIALSERALGMAERIADRATLAFCLAARHMALQGPDHVVERTRVADRIVRLAEQAGAKETLAGGLLWRIIDQLELGEVAAVDVDIERYVRLANELRLPFLLWQATALRAMRAQLAGRLAEAEDLANAALALGRRARSPNAELLHAVQLVVLRREQRRSAEVEPLLRALVEQFPALPAFRSGLALVYAELGREADARAHFEALAAGGFAAIPRDANWLNAHDELAQTCAFLGDTARAQTLYERLVPYAERSIVVSFAEATDGSVARYLGLLARTLGRHEEAAAHFRDAIACNERMGAAGQAAHARRELAELLLQRGGDGDAADAAALCDAAIAAYARLGMDRFAELARTLRVPGSRREAERGATRGSAAGSSTASGSGAVPQVRIFRHEGDYWAVGDQSAVVRLKHSKGLGYIAHLLSRPAEPRHVLDLVALLDQAPVATGASSGLPGLDREARAAYRQRRSDLEEELAEAERFNDLSRSEAMRAEIEFLERELTAGYGLGGRPRRTGEPVERLRKSVSNRIRDAIARVDRVHPALGSHLAHSVRTGILCEYRPETAVDWQL